MHHEHDALKTLIVSVDYRLSIISIDYRLSIISIDYRLSIISIDYSHEDMDYRRKEGLRVSIDIIQISCNLSTKKKKLTIQIGGVYEDPPFKNHIVKF
jgi:hypothetical protein